MIQLSHSRCFPKRKESICTSIKICRWTLMAMSPKMRINHVSINRWMNEQIVLCHTMDYYSAIKRNVLLCTTAQLNVKIIRLKEVRENQENQGHAIWFYLCNILENANPSDRKKITGCQERGVGSREGQGAYKWPWGTLRWWRGSLSWLWWWFHRCMCRSNSKWYTTYTRAV